MSPPDQPRAGSSALVGAFRRLGGVGSGDSLTLVAEKKLGHPWSTCGPWTPGVLWLLESNHLSFPPAGFCASQVVAHGRLSISRGGVSRGFLWPT